MADTPNTATTLTANFREVYADDLKDLRPSRYILQKNIRYKQSAKLGKTYHEPVLLAREGGFTYAAANTSSVTYKGALPSVLGDANIDGSQIFGHSFLDFEAAARGESSKHAFRNSVGIVIESLWDASQHRQEVDLWYGQSTDGLGIADTGTTTTVFEVTEATWAPGIWTACEGNKVEIFSTAFGASRGTETISKVDVKNRQITLASAVSGMTSTDLICFEGQYSSGWLTMIGLNRALDSNLTSLWNISKNYSRWCPVDYDASGGGGALTLGKVQDVVQQLVQGGLDEPVTLLMSNKTWGTICTDWASLVRFNDRTNTYTLGAESLKIISNGVRVDVVATPYCREGSAYIIPFSAYRRIGATDLTSDIPGRKGQDLFTLVHGTNTYEFQTYQHIALFGTPGTSARITGITNTVS